MITSLKKTQRRQMCLEMLGGKCAQCFSEENLHFDHINPASKTASVSQLYDADIETLLREVGKCQLLCRVCHSYKTKQEQYDYHGDMLHGKLSTYKNYGCRCNECREANARYVDSSGYLRAYRERKGPARVKMQRVDI